MFTSHFSPNVSTWPSVVSSPSTLPSANCEIVRLDLADRAEALLLMRGVDHLAAKDAAVFMERDDQCAAELAEQALKSGFLSLE